MLKNFCLNCALLIFATQTNAITLICDYRDKNTGISFDRKISIDLDKKQISLFKNVLQYNVWDDRILIYAKLEEACLRTMCFNHSWYINRYTLKSDWSYKGNNRELDAEGTCQIVTADDKKF